jgi:transcriptional regulator
MHPNPAFRQTPADRNLAFARERGFGILSVNGPDGPMAAHVPFVLSPDGKVAEMHLVRSNPIARALGEARPALLAVSGPDAYVSPDWYGLDHQVPTWNYIAVHMRGVLELLPQDDMRPHLDALSARFENDLRPKAPWLLDKMPDGALDRMMRQIVPVSLSIREVQGTWKLGQNKTPEVRAAAAAAMEQSPLGGDPKAIAAMMRKVDS